MEFFKFVDGTVELARNEIALIQPVADILKRDKGGKVTGDPDGRKKAYAFKELTYVYFRCNFYAYPTQHGLSDKEAHIWAVRNAGLPEQYEPDSLVKSLMYQYKEEHLSVSKKTIKSLVDVFKLNDMLIERITKSIKVIIDKDTVLSKQEIEDAISYQKDLMAISTQVPQQAQKLREALSLVQEEEKQIQIRKGGEEVNESMNPDNDIENW